MDVCVRFEGYSIKNYRATIGYNTQTESRT